MKTRTFGILLFQWRLVWRQPHEYWRLSQFGPIYMLEYW